MNPKIGIVTVLYNSERVLLEFFDSLGIQTYQNFVLYVIDNKSPDNSLQMSTELSKSHTFSTKIIACEVNYGVAKGNNIGIKAALEDECDFVLLSNNDVVLLPETIERLLKGMTMHGTNMAVPKIYIYDTNQFWAAGGRFIKHRGFVGHFGAKEIDNGQYDVAKSVNYAPTCFMLIHKDVFNKVGFMDEKYFVYWDDTDFVYRAIKKNETLWYLPDAVLYHNESTSTGKNSKFRSYYMSRNFIYFARKNYSMFYRLYVIVFNLTEHFTKHLFKMNFSLWKESLRGYVDGFRMKV